MTISIWRYTHLTLALVSSLFLLLASLTGCILAYDAIQQKLPGYKVENFEQITLGESLKVLKKNYPELIELSLDHNQFVRLKAVDSQGNDIDKYIDPRSGKILGDPIKKTEFIKWITAFHRSLFLHEAGRLFVGLIAFLLVIISFSGFILILKRQQSISNFFSTIVKDNFAQYYHVVLGRWFLIPILLIALSGTYLCLEKFNFFLPNTKQEAKMTIAKKATNAFAVEKTKLTDIEKIEFPFSEDPEDYYIISLSDREIEVNQLSLAVVSEKLYPTTKLVSELSLDVHTGRSNAFWALLLGISSLNILFFMYSGFAMTLRRRRSRIKNKYKSEDSKYILLLGSENGSTLGFANAVQQQLINLGEKAFLSELNDYNRYKKAEYLIIFTSTHGLGDAPSNANKFLGLLKHIDQGQKIKTAVVGFGSKAYPDYCGFAKTVQQELQNANWSESFLPLHMIHDKSAAEFVDWIKLWNTKSQLQLSTTPSIYNHIPKGLQKFVVIANTATSENESTFILTLKSGSKFESGDLLAIYPNNDGRERLYSIGKRNGNIQLIIKLHPFGLGSGYLHRLQEGETLQGRILSNPAFHLPKKANKLALISNGTGIAPFLGMIEQNSKKKELYLYSGFRQETQRVVEYKKFAQQMIDTQQLQCFNIALSRQENHTYVMDLIRRDACFFTDLLMGGGHIMICGSLSMQSDVEAQLTELCQNHTNQSFASFKENGQILTDCY